MATLHKIIDIQNVGRFEKLSAAGNIRFSKVNLVYGENGWGKSTLADILRSLSNQEPAILQGRETLASTGQQKVVLLIDAQQCTFDGSIWAGTQPRIFVFDQTFINENIYSGDSVSLEHLKRQYGLVVGATGVALIGQIQHTENELKEVTRQLKEKDQFLVATATTLGLPRISASDFVKLSLLNNADKTIAEMEKELRRATEKEQTRKANLPQLLPVPTSGTDLTAVLDRSIEGVADDLRGKLQNHIGRHTVPDLKPSIAHEEWLESGHSFEAGSDCPYCGQELNDRSLLNLYRDYFSDAYKELAADVKLKRQTLDRYVRGDFRQTLLLGFEAGRAAIENLKTLTGEDCGATLAANDVANQMEAAAAELDGFFRDKQEDLVSAIAPVKYDDERHAWDLGRVTIINYNQEIQTYNERITSIRLALSNANIDQMRSQLALLKARAKRYETEIALVVDERTVLTKRQSTLKKEKDSLRSQLTEHTKSVTNRLGPTINSYLDRLGAGFSIDYHEPNYRASEPAASYSILINKVAVPPRGDDAAIPSFRNTLSSGDKSVLALALFLATVNAAPNLAESIVVFDDPFTSMDEFRRTFTVNEINKLADRTAQVFVFSHELGFLRLLWDRIDQSNISSCAIQTGAPRLATLALFNLEAATLPRNETERMKIIAFIDMTEGEPANVRATLRKVLEDFYRNGDRELFEAGETVNSRPKLCHVAE